LGKTTGIGRGRMKTSTVEAHCWKNPCNLF